MLLKLLRRLRGPREAGVAADDPCRPPACGEVERLCAAGNRALAQGALAEAEDAYRALLALDPAHLDALCGLGVLRAHATDYECARRNLEAVVERAPQRIDALISLGNVYRELDRLEEAIALLERGCGLAPDSADAHLALARALREAGKAEDALRVATAATAMHPQRFDLSLELALAQEDCDRSEDSLRSVEQAIAMSPGFAEAHLARAFHLLADGRFQEGWSEYEWRLPLVFYQYRERASGPEAVLHAASAGGRLRLRAEQGLGDQIMFSSCIPDLLRHAPDVVMTCDRRLERLMQRSFAGLRVMPDTAEPLQDGPQARYVDLPIGSLPGLFRRTRAEFPRHDGYLLPDTSRVSDWRQRLDALGGGLKVGISWRGGLRQTRSRLRSVPLDVLAGALSKAASVHFVSLQYGEVREELDRFERQSGSRIWHWPEALHDYDETAALMGALDLVVSVCTSVVHLAGALGRPVWVLAPRVAEWRYGRRGSAMPWYPSATVFRQSELGNWEEPMDAIVRALRSKSASA
jgi:tetratricopeptide (TPR) repeat protein